MSSRKEAKQRLRREMLAIRRSLSAEEIEKGSEAIAAYFCAWPEYRSAEVVMFFLAMADEPQTVALIEDAWRAGKKVAVPQMGEVYGFMEAAALDGWDNLVTGRLGLKAPDPAKTRLIDPAAIELIVVPGVAFDATGRRLGMGAGYYDRFLPRASQARRMGLAWSAQLVAEVPADEHDVRMDYLLTENGFWPLSGG
ncbi:5-formyltetrahydrofolate cyclo-ligase [Anaeroselena agilis]|uniref:5-formyltetrahydrofolate cyclo-ligase n=1 Tax=Anaeroselena agilis TaxID=3063788 RepID=A0ABU3NW15_9FIRM|nr:5-formyltetrahydrofolate cyclo-ligase [Selenomonadales bacterium 4137-cl]